VTRLGGERKHLAGTTRENDSGRSMQKIELQCSSEKKFSPGQNAAVKGGPTILLLGGGCVKRKGGEERKPSERGIRRTENPGAFSNEKGEKIVLASVSDVQGMEGGGKLKKG